MDPEELMRSAFGAIADADATISALTGRGPGVGSLNLVEFDNLGQVAKPVMTMFLVSMPAVGAKGNTWDAFWQFDAHADETAEGDLVAGKVCSDLLQALESALSWTNLDAQALDATPTRPRPRRREIATGDGAKRQKMLEMTFRITAP